MTDNFNDGIFEGMLKAAFTEYCDSEDDNFPSDEELAKEFPMPKKILKDIEKRLKKQNRRQPVYMVYIKRAAIIVLAVLSIGFGTLMLDTEVRAMVKDTFVNWFETFIDFDFGKKQELGKFEAKTIDSLTVGYVPEGFTLYNELSKPESRIIYYTNDSGKYVTISIMKTGDTGVSTDVEHHGYNEIVINNYQAYITYDTEQMSGSVVWGNEYLTIKISGSTNKNELIKIAEGIKETKG